MTEYCQSALGSNIKRKTRNESEKRRRDAFNRLIAELTALVADGDSKMDKSNVLKCAINFLKERQVRAESTTEDASRMLDARLRSVLECTSQELVRLYMDALSAGAFTVSCTGILHNVSSAFAHLFSSTVADMIGKNVLDLLDAESCARLEETLSSEVLRAAAASTSGNSLSLESPIVQLNVVTCPLQRHILMIGKVKRVSIPQLTSENSDESLKNRGNSANDGHDFDANNQFVNTTTTLCFVGIARPLSSVPCREISFDSAAANTRKAAFMIVYNTEFICIHTDYSCSLLLGYTRIELLGTSGYDYVHTDDLANLAEDHKILIKRGIHQIAPHRLRTKGNQWMWVRCSASIECGSVARVKCVYSLSQRLKSSSGERIIADSTKLRVPADPAAVASQANSSLLSGSVGCTPSPSALAAPSPLRVSAIASPPAAPVCVAPTVCGIRSAFYSKETAKESTQDLASTSVTFSKTSSNELSAAQSSKTIAKIAVEPLPSQRIKRAHTFNGTPLRSPKPVETVLLSPCTSDDVVASPGSVSSSNVSPASCANAVSPKRRLQQPLVYIEHFPLPESKAETSELPSTSAEPNPSSYNKDFTGAEVEGPLTISPMYRHIWEELQRKSEILRQQVLQKEMELQQLHLKQLFTSLRGNKAA